MSTARDIAIRQKGRPLPPLRTASGDMDEIAAVAAEVRTKEVDAYGLGEDPPAAMCLEFSKTLRQALEDAGFDAVVIQGQFEVDEPNIEYYGDWDGDEMDPAMSTPLHYWAEATGRGGRAFPEPIAADITADQFNDELDSEADYMEPVEVGPYSFLPRHIRGGETGLQASKYHAAVAVLGRLAESDVPPAALRRGEEMLAAVANTMLVGDTDTVDGWFIETHTLGCRNAADDPETEWLDRHWAIYDEYRADPRSVVVGDPDDGGAFVTFTPLRGTVATRVEAWSRDTLEWGTMCNECGADLSVAGRFGDDDNPLCKGCWTRHERAKLEGEESPPTPRKWWQRWKAASSARTIL